LSQADIEILFPEPLIAGRVKELATQINHDYASEPVILVTVLRGGFVFLSDLMRQLKIECSIDFLAISPYEASSGAVRVVKDLDDPIAGMNVLIVEDIVDTGLTLNYLVKTLMARKPRSLKICTLLDRPARRIAALDLEYVGFEVSDHFVVGYGLDFKGLHRNLPYIGLIDPGDIDWNTEPSTRKRS